MTNQPKKTLQIYDADDTLIIQAFEVDGELIRLPRLSYFGFCQSLGISTQDAEKCLRLFKSHSDLLAFKTILNCPWQSPIAHFKL